MRNVKRIRSKQRPRVSAAEEAFDGNGLLRSEFQMTDMEDKLEARQRRSAQLAADVDGEYTPPLIVELVMHHDFVHAQFTHKYPWAVVWFDQRGGRQMKKHETLGGAVLFHRRILPVRKTATVISRARGYDVPYKYRGRLPGAWKWCPYCCKPRKYHRREPQEVFFAIVKVWSESKGRFEHKERKLAVMECPVCLRTNMDHIFRRSNQPWERKRLKKGAHKARKVRRKTA